MYHGRRSGRLPRFRPIHLRRLQIGCTVRIPTAPDGARGCSALGRYNGEPLAGTAGQNTGWLLVEHPGAWKKDAFASDGLDPDVAAELKRRAADAGVRPLLIKRDDRGSSQGTRHAYLVHSGRDNPWTRRFEFMSQSALLELDLQQARESSPPDAGTAVSRPMYLVCTHAKRDACCAMYGRPIAETLGKEHAGVWQCSHLGGDRFAANMAALPHGVSFGRLNVESGREIVREFDAGSIALESYRGRCLDSFPVQTAEAVVRRRMGLHGVDAIRPTAERSTSDGFEVDFRHGSDVTTVTVVKTETTVCATDCSALEPSTAIRYRVVDDADSTAAFAAGASARRL